MVRTLVGRVGRRSTLATLVLSSVSFSVLGLLLEAVWVVRRRLPSLEGLDASGMLAGPAQRREPIRLVVLGDSSLTGPGLSHADQIWIRQALMRLDRDRPIEVVSLAVGGSRVADVGRVVDDALAVGANAAVLAVGANDAIHGTPTGSFARDLDGCLRRLLEQIPVVAVTNVGDLGNVARIPAPLSSVVRRRSRVICGAIERVVDRHPGAVLLDVRPADPGFRDRRVYADDLFHPNPEGHSLWAEAVLPGLEQALSLAVPG